MHKCQWTCKSSITLTFYIWTSTVSLLILLHSVTTNRAFDCVILCQIILLILIMASLDYEHKLTWTFIPTTRRLFAYCDLGIPWYFNVVDDVTVDLVVVCSNLQTSKMLRSRQKNIRKGWKMFFHFEIEEDLQAASWRATVSLTFPVIWCSRYTAQHTLQVILWNKLLRSNKTAYFLLCIKLPAWVSSL